MADYLAVLGFVAFMVGTPGPANLLLMLAGMQQGLRGCFGFILGLVFGKVLLNFLVGSGFDVVLSSHPVSQAVLTYTCALYMIFLTIRSWPGLVKLHSNDKSSHLKKFNFREGVFVHPLNPKAWLMVVFAWGNFAPSFGNFSHQLLIITGIFAVCQLFFHSIWASVGVFLERKFADNQWIKKIMTLVTILVILMSLMNMPLF